MTKMSRFSLLLLVAAAVGLLAQSAPAQQPAEIKVGLLVPLSGLYARPGAVMRMRAVMAVADINAQGGIKALGGAKLRLVVLDSGETTEQAKNAAQRMVAQETDLVTASGSYLNSFTLAVTEVTERALSELVKLAEAASGSRPKTIAIITDNTAASISSVKPMKEKLLDQLGIKLVVDETFTPPLSDATPLVQRLRTAKPDMLFFLPTVISDAKLMIEEMNEFGLGQGRLPTISFASRSRSRTWSRP